MLTSCMPWSSGFGILKCAFVLYCGMQIRQFAALSMQVITVLRKLLGAEMKAKASNNAELRPQTSSTPSD